MCSERQFSLVQFTSADVNPGLELQGPDSGLGWGGRDDSFFSERRYASAVITMPICAYMTQIGVLMKRLNGSNWFWHGGDLS